MFNSDCKLKIGLVLKLLERTCCQCRKEQCNQNKILIFVCHLLIIIKFSDLYSTLDSNRRPQPQYKAAASGLQYKDLWSYYQIQKQVLVLKLCFQGEVHSTSIHGILLVLKIIMHNFSLLKKEMPPLDPCISPKLATHTTILFYNFVFTKSYVVQPNCNACGHL